MKNFFGELKRRNVVRVGVAYAIIAWLALQAAEILLPGFGAPDWVFKTIVLLIVLGLPFALLFAWAFELTSEGIKKTRDVNVAASVTASTGRKLDFVIIAALVLGLGYFIWERQAADEPPAESTAAAESAEAETVAEDEQPRTRTSRSIAVLPFDDLSRDGDQEWFADGLAEEILNSLARTPDLLVSARTSSFAYKDSDADAPTIAAALGVEHILEGSVRRSDTRLRVTAQLIRASDGFHLWSDTFDSDIADMIEIQESVAIEIARALETAMDPEALAAMVSSGTHSVPAYEAYLEGLSYGLGSTSTGDLYEYVATREAFERAVELDPEFGAAYWRLALFWDDVRSPSNFAFGILDLSTEEMRSKQDEALKNAIRYERNEVTRTWYRSFQAYQRAQYAQAYRLNTEYLEQRPNDYDAQFQQLYQQIIFGDKEQLRETMVSYMQISGHDSQVVNSVVQYSLFLDDDEFTRAQARQAMANLPDDIFTRYQVHRALLWAGDIDGAARLLPAISASDFEESIRILAEIRQACAENRLDDASRMFERMETELTDDYWSQWWALKMRGRDQEATQLIMEFNDARDFDILDNFITYAFFDVRPLHNYVAHLEAKGATINVPMEIPYQCHFDST